jgi:hypothetical protein
MIRYPCGRLAVIQTETRRADRKKVVALDHAQFGNYVRE